MTNGTDDARRVQESKDHITAAVLISEQLEQAYMLLGQAYFLGEPIDLHMRECEKWLDKWHRLQLSTGR